MHNSAEKDLAWFRTDGQEMTEAEWNAGWVRSFAVLLNGNTLEEVDDVGRRGVDDSYLILVNAHHEAVSYNIPPSPRGHGWERIVNTANLDNAFERGRIGDQDEVAAR